MQSVYTVGTGLSIGYFFRPGLPRFAISDFKKDEV
jgi:hypothetical protein